MDLGATRSDSNRRGTDPAPRGRDDRRDVPVTGIAGPRSSEAVYFVLRGLGMKASQGPNCLPRIEVMACQHPKLFAALRRLNLRHVRDTIILEPSGSGPGNPASADRSVERQVRTDVSPPTDTAHPAPLLRGASSSSLAAQQREQRKKRIRDRKAAAIERLAAPKFLSAKLPFQMAWIEEHRREGEAVPVKPPVAWRNPTARHGRIERFRPRCVGFHGFQG
eukprot:g30173.t1